MSAIWRLVLKYGAVIAAIWAVFTWFQQRKDAFDAQQRQAQQAHELAVRESQKPFLEKQLAFYFEAAKITGKLATLDPAVKSAQPGFEDWA